MKLTELSYQISDEFHVDSERVLENLKNKNSHEIIKKLSKEFSLDADTIKKFLKTIKKEISFNKQFEKKFSKKIETDLVFRLLFYLQQFKDFEQGKKYYYQYESDSNGTIYELIMSENAIAIHSSKNVAEILTFILRIMFDGHSGCIDYLEYKDGSEIIFKETYIQKIALELINNKSLSNYDDCCAKELKKTSIKKFEGIKIDKPKIFDIEKVTKILLDPEFQKVFDDKQKRLEYLLK